MPVIPDVCSAALWVTEFTRICALGLGMMLQLFSGDTRGSTQPLRIICSFRWESSDHGGYNFPQQMSKVNTMLLILDSQHFQNKKVLPNIFFFSDCLPLFHFIGGSALDVTRFMAGNESQLVK